jgi:hypothetical protein
MKIAFYFCTRSARAEDTLTFKSLLRIKEKNNDFDIFYKTNNTDGLSKNYNQILNKHQSNYDCIVFIHDDVYVDDFNICDKLAKAHEQFDIVGLAGGINPRITKHALWHIMCGGFNSGNLRGAVAHYINETQHYMTSFGVTPARVAILDGLFLSVSTASAIKSNWKFNENYSFHHYDIASCIDANKKKLKLGVYPIWTIHKSPGLLDPASKTFLENQEKFIEEYSSN